MKQQDYDDSAYRALKPLLMILAFLVHTLVLLMIAGGAFVSLVLVVASDLGLFPRIMALGSAGFMGWLLAIAVPAWWRSWFKKPWF